MVHVDLCGFNRHGAVDVDREPGQATLSEGLFNVVEQILGAADGETRHEDLALRLQRMLDDADRFIDRILQGFMVTVTIGRFHDHHVGLREWFRVTYDRHSP